MIKIRHVEEPMYVQYVVAQITHVGVGGSLLNGFPAQTQQLQGHEQAAKPLSNNAVMRLMPIYDPVQVSLIGGNLVQPSW
ncbi:hypothetical protein TNCV_4994731 [Trichonephila clavipes]|nr:hypothetical protein TNCV_4994731 [Trichonephila clavipes]